MVRHSPRSATMLLAMALAAALVGCGKSALRRHPAGGGPTGTIAPVAAQGAVSVVTKNTARVGGPDAASDAAAVARAVYPGLTATTRPEAVVVVDERNWAASLAAAVLASAPLRAPLLYSEGGTLPEVSLQALEALHPTGAPALGGMQVVLLGNAVAVPSVYRSRTVTLGASAAAASAAVERLSTVSHGSKPRQVIVVAAGAQRALQMPAAGLAAESGAPILVAGPAGVPSATAAVLSRLGRPAIYLVGFSSIPKRLLSELARYGRVTPIAEASTPGEGLTPVGNAIAVARFTDGVFGWGVKEPGHGLVFANATRVPDAPAASLLSSTGSYGPLLLLDGATGVPSALASYLSDIQPAYGKAPQYQPVHGAYNHGWLIGDESAISPATQAEIDAILEIVPATAASEESSTLTPE